MSPPFYVSPSCVSISVIPCPSVTLTCLCLSLSVLVTLFPFDSPSFHVRYIEFCFPCFIGQILSSCVFHPLLRVSISCVFSSSVFLCSLSRRCHLLMLCVCVCASQGLWFQLVYSRFALFVTVYCSISQLPANKALS